MGPTRGFDSVTDNVVLKQQFLAAHPNVTITHSGEPDYLWTGVIDYGNNVHSTITRYDLGDLLTQLAAVVGDSSTSSGV